MRITLDELKNVKTFKEHEEGRYTMRIVAAKEGVSSQKGTEFLQIDCETMNDDVFSISNRFYNTEKSLSILLNFLSSVGFYQEGEMVEFEPDDLLGAIFSVELKKDDPTPDGKVYLRFVPWTCEEVSGQATPKKASKKVEESSEMPF
jgi:hypothetical protein